MNPSEQKEHYRLIRAHAEKIGAIEECELHKGFFMTSLNEDLEKRLYAVAAKMQQDGELSGTLQEVHNTVKSVLNDTGMDCAECERIAAAS